MTQPDFDGDFVSFAAAGLDKEFTLFKIYSRKLNDTKTGEVGVFDLECRYPLAEFETHADSIGLLKFLVRKFLIHAHKSTGVPAEQWVVEFSPIMERYQIPSHLFLDTKRDRAWLV